MRADRGQQRDPPTTPGQRRQIGELTDKASADWQGRVGFAVICLNIGCWRAAPGECLNDPTIAPGEDYG